MVFGRYNLVPGRRSAATSGTRRPGRGDKDDAVDDDTTCAPLDTEVAEALAAIPIDIGSCSAG